MELIPEHRTAVNMVLDFITKGDFYLAGGTAVFYYLNHRESLDLGFLTEKKIDFKKLKSLFDKFKVSYFTADTIHIEVKGVKCSFFYYPYPLLNPLKEIEVIRVASLDDIACMKLLAIIQRGSKKDFIDLYFIMNTCDVMPETLKALFIKKYGNFNPLVIHKAITFFEDADKEPEPKMLKPVVWKDVKAFFY